MNNRFSKWFALFMMMMTGANTGWSQTLSLEDFYIEMGTTQLVTIDLVQGDYPVLGFQADVVLPEGLKIQRVKAVNGILPDDEWGEPINPSVSYTNGHLLMYNDKGLTINEDATSLVTLYVSAESDFQGGEIVLKNIILSGENNVKITPNNVIAQVTTNYVPPLTNDPALALSDFFIEAGLTKQVTIDLVKGKMPILGFQTDITLPEGLEIQRVKAVNGILPSDEWGDPITPSVSYTNGHLLLYNDKGVTINEDASSLVTLYMSAASTFSGGVITLSNVVVSGEGNVKITPPNVTATVTSNYIEPTTYSIRVRASKNGEVAVNKTEAFEGETVPVTISAAEGYELDTLVIRTTTGLSIELAADNTFVMPAAHVIITATFKEQDVPPVVNPAITMDGFEISAGETTQVTIDLIPGTIPVLGFQTDITLPEGLTIQRVKAVEGILPNDEWGDPITPSVSYTNGHLLLYNDKGVTINDDATALVTLYVVAASDFIGGEMVLDNIIISGEGNVKITPEPLFVEVTSDYVEPITDLYYNRGHSTLEVSEDYEYQTLVLDHTQEYGVNEYGALTINGNAVLTTGMFSLYADPYMEWAERGNLANHSAALVNNVEMHAEDICAELWIPEGKWTFLSFPYDVRVSEILLQSASTEWVIRKYDGQQRAEGNMDDTWVNMKANDVLNAYEGYIWQPARKWGRTGFIVPVLDTENKENIFANDQVEVSLKGYDSEFAHNRSWNLVGNPYPCYYHIGAMEFAAPITTWDVNSQCYQAYRPGDDDYVLCPFEAFFVQRPETEENIVFHPEGRQTNRYVSAYNVKGFARARAITDRRDVLNLTLSDGIYTDRTRVVVNESALSGYELDKDASKFLSSNSLAPQLFSVDGGLCYAINERPFDDGVITLGTTLVNSGRYTIALQTTSDMAVTLEDKETGALVQLNGTEGYSFTAQSGTLKNRFVIHLTNPTGIDHVKQTPSITDAEIFTLDGRRVQKMTTSGIYIVKQGERVVKQYVK